MPDEREGVVEDVCWVGPSVAGINHIGPVGLSQLHLHELGKVLFNLPHLKRKMAQSRVLYLFIHIFWEVSCRRLVQHPELRLVLIEIGS